MISAYRRLLIPGVSTLIMLVVLVGLGTWQLYRLQWKNAIVSRIATAESAPAVPLTLDPAPYTPAPYSKVSVTGRFRFDQAAQFGTEVRDTRAGAAIGFHQIVPLEREGGSPVLVDRGWVPQIRETRLADPEDPVTVTGYIRPGEAARWFSPADDLAARQFYTLDPTVIGPAVGVPSVAPFILVAVGPALPQVYPTPAQHLPRPPNNHLSYVITWYGLAFALVIIFGVGVRKALRS